jgi:adenylate cyclase
MSDIFISYSRKDSEQALSLAERLRGEGMSVWIDQQGIEAAASWSKEIVHAIDECCTVIVLLSASSTVSQNVAKEISIACDANKQVLPVALDDLSNELRYHLAGIQRVAYSEFASIMQALLISGVTSSTIPEKALGSDRKSLMILPFEDLSPTRDNGWFAEGLMSELISRLGQIKSLRLIDQKTSTELGRAKIKLAAISQELNVRYFIEGSVRKFGDQIKVNVGLLDFEHGEYLWQNNHKGEFKDIFGIQEQVASKVVEGLNLHLTKAEHSSLQEQGTENPEAYELYLKGLEYMFRHDKHGYYFAVELFKQALQLDPEFASAAAQASISLGTLYLVYDRNDRLLDEAEKLAKQAYELNANLEIPSEPLALVFRVKGDFEAAEALLVRSLKRDPENPVRNFALASHYDHCLQNKEAITYYQRVLARAEITNAYSNLFVVYLRQNDSENATKWALRALPDIERRLRLSPDNDSYRTWHAVYLQHLGRDQEARAEISIVLQRPEIDSAVAYNIACLQTSLEDHHNALATLRRCVSAGYARPEQFRTDPDFAPLHDMPEFMQLMVEIEEAQRNA